MILLVLAGIIPPALPVVKALAPVAKARRSSDARRARGAHSINGGSGLTSSIGAATRLSFRSCTEARAAGAAPLRAGQLGYSTRLDRDRDGVACE